MVCLNYINKVKLNFCMEVYGEKCFVISFTLSFSFYKSNYVQRFHYSRPTRKGSVDPENEFAVSIFLCFEHSHVICHSDVTHGIAQAIIHTLLVGRRGAKCHRSIIGLDKQGVKLL